MTASQPTPASRSRLPLIIAGVALIVVLAAAAGVAYMLSGSAPAAVSLATATPSATAAASALAPTTASSATPSSTIAPSAASASSGSAAGGGSAGALDGTWTVDTSTGSFSDFSSSFVGYRVNENLANVGAATAVGRTPKVSGSLTLSGTTIAAVKVTADLTALQSDKPMRDGQLQGQALQTDQFPTATFELTAPITLPSLPTGGQMISVTASGNLTLHGVTKAVSIPLQAKMSGSTMTVVGSLPITFADYSIQPPQSMMVLSVDDHGVMELQLHFTHA